MGKLQGKVALVTGGNSGIGRAIANQFAEEGAHVYIVGRREAELAKVAAEIGSNATYIQADITQLAQLEMIYLRIGKETGKLDIVVANAGRVETRPIAEADEGHFDRIFDLNVRSAFFTVQKAIPLLSGGASVIFVSSSLNVRSDPGASVYIASKAAVHSLSKTFAVELISRGARVNTLSPGPIDTPIVETVSKTPEEAAAFRKWAATEVPMGRMGKPQEVAAAAVFLASDESSFSTGMELRVDGGHAELQHPQKTSQF
ncbi:hypothetical protein Plec18170_003512 [Paecilomyces lecythidis]